MSNDWRNEFATEEQKEKLRFFGCTWCGDITMGKASDALEECAKQFPGIEAAYKNRPITDDQLDELRSLGQEPVRKFTCGEAMELIESIKTRNAKRREDAAAIIQKETNAKVEAHLHPGAPQIADENLTTIIDRYPLESTIQEPGMVASPSAAITGQHDGKTTDQDWRNASATEKQKEKLRAFGCKFDEDISVGQASDTLVEFARQFPDREAIWQLQKRKWAKVPGKFSVKEFDQLEKPPAQKITIQKTEQDAPQPSVRHEGFFYGESSPAKSAEQLDGKTTDQDWHNAPATDKQKQTADEQHGTDAPRVSEAGGSKGAIEWDKWFKERRNQPDKTLSEEVTIQEATKPQNSSPREIIPEVPKDLRPSYQMFCPVCDGRIEVLLGAVGKICACPNCKAEVTPVFFKSTSANNFIPARVAPNYTQPRPAIHKPTTYISNIPIERFTKWLDIVLERNNKCLGGHWLPVGHVFYPFREYTTLTKGLCCQIADAIESRGYCVEPDARFGSGKYEKLDTLALFKSFDGDPIRPSTAYLGAANLLRLCIHITTADGQIDLVELDVFSQAIENLHGLSLTDHKRLLILEQLLVQELSSASKTAAKIARAVPADKRLVIGKLLVEVAAANNFITDGERRALEDIFKLLKIRDDTLEKLINEVCPWPQREVVQNDVSEGDRQLWNQWRIEHPGVVVDDSTLTEMKWNFNDWKALNARWRDLHNKLAARKEQSRTAPEAGSQKISVLATFLAAGRRLGIRGKKIPEPIAMPAPKDFALDPAKIFAIQNDTKEVTAILSIVMEDEPEKLFAPSATITLPAQEIPKVSSYSNPSVQPTRFNGLDAAFHPVLERLLARDSWPQKDFKSLADEFHFMPLNIRDTLNEWADEKLGDFILDGEDPPRRF
jgi:uncharacterized tellurite resistance protein B-like protein